MGRAVPVPRPLTNATPWGAPAMLCSMNNAPVSIRTLLMPLNTPMLRKALLQDKSA